MTETQQAALNVELRNLVPTVYYSYSDVPEAAFVSQPLTDDDRERFQAYLNQGVSSAESLRAYERQLRVGRRYLGFKDGFRVNWDRCGSGLFWMRCGSGLHFASEGAEGMDAIYVWVLGFWIKLYTVSHWMA